MIKFLIKYIDKLTYCFDKATIFIDKLNKRLSINNYTQEDELLALLLLVILLFIVISIIKGLL